MNCFSLPSGRINEDLINILNVQMDVSVGKYFSRRDAEIKKIKNLPILFFRNSTNVTSKETGPDSSGPVFGTQPEVRIPEIFPARRVELQWYRGLAF